MSLKATDLVAGKTVADFQSASYLTNATDGVAGLYTTDVVAITKNEARMMALVVAGITAIVSSKVTRKRVADRKPAIGGLLF